VNAAPGDAPGPLRRRGYRLVGPRLDYVLHLRPAEWPIMAAHTTLGYLIAVGLHGAARGQAIGAAALGIALWVVCLNGGTLAINSAFDNDEGDIAYLRRPPPPPQHLFGFGFGLMLMGLGIALVVLPLAYSLAYIVCLAMSVVYSVPPVRLKAVAGADWIINMIGFGTLTPFAGWATTGRALDMAHGLVLLAFCPLFAALYPLTQLYQMDEDRARGDRTLALRLGLTRSLDVALVAALVAFVLLLVAGVQSEWNAADAGRWAALGAGAAAWAAVLLPWRMRSGRMTRAAHQRGMYLALGAWAVTDIGVALAWGIWPLGRA
ncbi:MAG: UbiA prenyltransferase family protein, partial [Gemmatimonadales bacterium]|nr:UbiA prenyltransferase family protein [Gemmatimonadales bacterium]